MIDLKHFASAIAQIEEEKGISKEKILETVEMAIAAAYKKDYGKRGQVIKAKLNPEDGSFKIWQEKTIVDESMIKTPEEAEQDREREDAEEVPEEIGEDAQQKVVFNEEKHIMLEEAKQYDESVQPGEILEFDLEIRDDFGRIAAQTAKQVIIQRMREAERDAVYEEFENKVDTIISGVMQRVEGNTVFFDLGKATGIMLPKDRVPQERYRVGQRMRLYLTAIEKGPKGPMIYVSRAHPKMISRLFELEVPEIGAGTVQVPAVAREPGSRSKIAVYSEEEGVDPIGSCVGQKGTRVAAVIQELGGEKIDIIEWKEDSAEFIINALSPAKVLDVELEKGRARAIVAEDQLSLAIGKDGQNVRLAAKLTGWKIDIVLKETGEVQESAEDTDPENNTADNEDGEEVDKESKESKESATEEEEKKDDAKNTKEEEEKKETDNDSKKEESKKEEDSSK